MPQDGGYSAYFWELLWIIIIALYEEQNATSPQEMNTFLESLDLPSKGKDQNKVLTPEITMEEIRNTISRCKANKAAGTGGFLAKWYKALKDQIAPILFNCFNYTFKDGKHPRTWKDAIITVIPKEGKDREECGSYRPISVWILNTDYKLYASILAKWLEHIILELNQEFNLKHYLKKKEAKQYHA